MWRAIGAIAAVVSAIAALGTWLFPLVKPNQSQNETPSQVARIEIPESTATEQTAREAKAEEHTPRRATQKENLPPEIEKDAREYERVRNFALADGEQRVLCSGLVGIAADFNVVSGVDLLTLRLNSGDESTFHAVMGAGARLKFTCEGKEKYISVTSLDLTEQSVALQID